MHENFDRASINILIVDDEPSVRESLRDWFEDEGYLVQTACDAAEALNVVRDKSFDIILLDIKMPGMDGLALQDRLREFDSEIIIIIITAFAAVDSAVRALKAGAFDYVTKPVDPDELTHLIRNAAQQRMLKKENIQLKESIETLHNVDDFIGDSQQMQEVFDLIRTVAPTESTVLVRGDSGTGKELIAKAIHSNSSRKYFPIIPVNCGALTESLIESELFGHEKGAFTGAQYRRKGSVEMANGGTLFLDEIGTLSLKSQIDLLRVLETKQFQRVGGEKTVIVDFRLICATNLDLEKAVQDGTFREDLYYRINVFSIHVPPLRERRSDIPLLTAHFIEKYATRMNKTVKPVSSDAMAAMIAYNWPGNVRELENAIERAMVVTSADSIRLQDLPMQFTNGNHPTHSESLAGMEKIHIIKTLDELSWNITRSAERLGIDRVTLYNKIQKYSLKRPK
jgi:two-component system, NtrC family, response regulator AtoC